MKRFIFIAGLLICLTQTGIGQVEEGNVPSVEDNSTVLDTTLKVKKGSIFAGRPGKAALYSLIIPGAGQIYNKSYLRVPFVYAAVGGMGYVMINNTRQYNCFAEAYMHAIDNDGVEPSEMCAKLGRTAIVSNASTIKLFRDRFNKSRQSAIVGFAAVWLANSIDAFVNAHLKDFDIEDDLSYHRPKIRVRPSFGQTSTGGGMVGVVVTF